MITVIVADQFGIEFERTQHRGNESYLLELSETHFPLLSNINLFSIDVFAAAQCQDLAAELDCLSDTLDDGWAVAYLARLASLCRATSKRRGFTLTFTPFE